MPARQRSFSEKDSRLEERETRDAYDVLYDQWHATPSLQEWSYQQHWVPDLIYPVDHDARCPYSYFTTDLRLVSRHLNYLDNGALIPVDQSTSAIQLDKYIYLMGPEIGHVAISLDYLTGKYPILSDPDQPGLLVASEELLDAVSALTGDYSLRQVIPWTGSSSHQEPVKGSRIEDTPRSQEVDLRHDESSRNGDAYDQSYHTVHQPSDSPPQQSRSKGSDSL